MCDSPRDGMETEPKTSPMAESKLAVDMVEKGEVEASSSSSGFMGPGLRLLTAAALRDMSGAASCCCCCHGGDCLQVSTRNSIMTTAEVLRWGGRSDSDVTTPAILLHPPPATWKLTISITFVLSILQFCSYILKCSTNDFSPPIFERVKHKSMTATEAESANTEQTDHLQEPAPGTHSISTWMWIDIDRYRYIGTGN